MVVGIPFIDAGPITADPQERDTGDVIVAFEVLSSPTRKRDLRWKTAAYPVLPSPTHSIAIARMAPRSAYLLAKRISSGKLRSPEDVIEIRSRGISLPVAEVYRSPV